VFCGPDIHNHCHRRSSRYQRCGAESQSPGRRPAELQPERARVLLNVKEPKQALATESALDLIGKLKARYCDLMFHQSGGCCDGSSPMCYPRGEFLLGDNDVRLGEIGDTPFYMSRS
jgi:hypothetical protein